MADSQEPNIKKEEEDGAAVASNENLGESQPEEEGDDASTTNSAPAASAKEGTNSGDYTLKEEPAEEVLPQSENSGVEKAKGDGSSGDEPEPNSEVPEAEVETAGGTREEVGQEEEEDGEESDSDDDSAPMSDEETPHGSKKQKPQETSSDSLPTKGDSEAAACGGAASATASASKTPPSKKRATPAAARTAAAASHKRSSSAAAAAATDVTSSSSTSSSRSRFPDKLHRLLDRCSVDPVESQTVSWMGNRAFKVHDPKQFAATILPRYFSTTTYKSFQRNLNLWGFTCIAKGPRRGVTFHPFFVRGNEGDLSSHMKRSGDTSKGVQVQQLRYNIESPPTTSSLLPPSVAAAAAAATGDATVNSVAALSAMNPALSSDDAVSALAALAATQFNPGLAAAMAAKQGMLPTSSSSAYRPLEFAETTAGVGAINSPSLGGDKKSNKRKKKINGGASPPSATGRKRSAKKNKGESTQSAKKEDRVPLRQHLVPEQHSTEPTMLKRMLEESAGHSNSNSGIDNSERGVHIQHLLALANQNGEINDVQQLLAIAQAKEEAATSAGIPTDLQRLLQQSQSGPASDMQQLLAWSRAGGMNTEDLALQQLLAQTGRGQANNALADTSQSNRFSVASALRNTGNDSGLSPQLAMLMRQQQLARQLQQQQAQPSGGMADLLTSLRGAPSQKETLLKDLGTLPKANDQTGANQESSTGANQESSLEQQLIQQRQALEQAMQVVQLQQQKLASLQQQQDQRLQLQHHLQQQHQASELRQLSFQQLLQQLQGGPPPLQLPPSVVQQLQAAESSAGPQSPSLDQLKQLLQSRQQSSALQAHLGLPPGATDGYTPIQLQQLLQSLGGSGAASTSLTAAASPTSLLQALQQQEGQNMLESSRLTSQQLLHLLQGQQLSDEEKVLLLRARGLGPDPNPSLN